MSRRRTVAIELSTWRSGRTGATRLETGGSRRRLQPAPLEAVPRGEKTPLGDEKAVSGDAE
jgi:hypothetical protein